MVMDRYRNKLVSGEIRIQIQIVTIIFMLPLMLNSGPLPGPGSKSRKTFYEVGKALQIFPNPDLRPSPAYIFSSRCWELRLPIWEQLEILHAFVTANSLPRSDLLASNLRPCGVSRLYL